MSNLDPQVPTGAQISHSPITEHAEFYRSRELDRPRGHRSGDLSRASESVAPLLVALSSSWTSCGPWAWPVSIDLIRSPVRYVPPGQDERAGSSSGEVEHEWEGEDDRPGPDGIHDHVTGLPVAPRARTSSWRSLSFRSTDCRSKAPVCLRGACRRSKGARSYLSPPQGPDRVGPLPRDARFPAWWHGT
jgi:hypothetical protein